MVKVVSIFFKRGLKTTPPSLKPQLLGTVHYGHTPFILFTLLSIFRDKLSNFKRIVPVPKSYIEIDLNFLK